MLKTWAIKHTTAQRFICLSTNVWPDFDIHLRSSLTNAFVRDIWARASYQVQDDHTDLRPVVRSVLEGHGYKLDLEKNVPVHRTDASWRVLLASFVGGIRLDELICEKQLETLNIPDNETTITSVVRQQRQDQTLRASTASITAPTVGAKTSLPVVEQLIACVAKTFVTRRDYENWSTMWRRLFYIILPAVANCDVLSPESTDSLIDLVEAHLRLFVRELNSMTKDEIRRTWYFHELEHWPNIARRVRASLNTRLVLRPAHFTQNQPERLNGRERNIKTKDIQLNDSADVFYKKRKLKRGGVKRRHNGKRKLGLTP